MSKLEQIKAALDRNQNAKIPILKEGGCFKDNLQTVTIFVTPNNEKKDEEAPSPEQLQELMSSLVPELTPDGQTDFQRETLDGEEVLVLGFMYFDEEVGVHKSSTCTTFKEEEGRLFPGVTSGEVYGKETVLRRRTYIRVFPKISHLVDGLGEDNVRTIARSNLYPRNLIRTIFKKVVHG